jgi:hypothetical protein
MVKNGSNETDSFSLTPICDKPERNCPQKISDKGLFLNSAFKENVNQY